MYVDILLGCLAPLFDIILHISARLDFVEFKSFFRAPVISTNYK